MSEFKGTPGPWRGTFKKYEGIEGCSGFNIYSQDGDEILFGCGCCGSPNVEKDGDMTLILAAPELLAALQSLLENHVELCNSGDCGHWDVEGDPQVIAARAAINKAIGK